MEKKIIEKKYSGIYTLGRLCNFLKEKGAVNVAGGIHYFETLDTYLASSYFNEGRKVELTIFGRDKEGIGKVENILLQGEKDFFIGGSSG